LEDLEVGLTAVPLGAEGEAARMALFRTAMADSAALKGEAQKIYLKGYEKLLAKIQDQMRR